LANCFASSWNSFANSSSSFFAFSTLKRFRCGFHYRCH
jgi:hypothetical protein